MSKLWSAFAGPRALADRAVVALASITVLAATVLVVAGPLYADAVTAAGLREQLRTADDEAAGYVVRALAPAGTGTDDSVRTTLPGFTIERVVRTPATTTPFLEADDQVAVVTALDDLGERVELTGGQLPEPGSTVEVVVADRVAERFALSVGERIQATVKTTGTRLPLTVAGTYRPVSDARDVVGIDTSGSFTTVSLLTIPRALDGAAVTLEHTWRARLPPDRQPPSRTTLAALEDRLRALDGVVWVRSELDELLAESEAALRATATAVSSSTLLLAVLALTTVVLASRVLVELRETNAALLRARGASPLQLGAASAMEGALVVLPAVLLAPPLATLVVRALSGVGSVAAADLRLEPSFSGYPLAAATALGGWIVFTAPAALASRTYVDAKRREGRRSRRSWPQRWQLDLVLGAVAGLTLWQLRQTVTDGGVNADGSLDPTIVAGPPLAIAAGAALALRGVPVIGRVLGSIGRGPARLDVRLAGTQIERRTPRYRVSVAVVVMAAALAVYALVYAATWSTAQYDRALAATGADVRVEAGATDERPDWADIPGVEAATPVHLTSFQPARGSRGTLVGLGPGRTTTVEHRTDVLQPTAIATLDAPRELPRLSLSEPSDRLRLDVTTEGDLTTRPLVRLVLERTDGQLVRTSSELVGGQQEVTFDLDAPVASLVGLELVATAPVARSAEEDASHQVRLHVASITTGAGSELPVGSQPWGAGDVSLRVAVEEPGTQLEVDDGLRLVAFTGTAALVAQPVVWRMTPGPADPTSTPVPAIVTDAGVAALGGPDAAGVRLPGGLLPIRIVATTPRLPGLVEEEIAVAVDGNALAAWRYVTEGVVAEPDAWMLATAPGAASDVGAAARQLPGEGRRVTVTAELATQLRRDPVRLGLSGALELAAVGAGVLALLAVLAHARVQAARQRAEYAFLAAVGTSRRTVRRWFVWESAATTGAGIAFAVALAWVLLQTVLPSIGLAPDTGWIPPTRLDVPLPPLAALSSTALTLVVVPPLLIEGRLAREDVAELIRAGEDV